MRPALLLASLAACLLVAVGWVAPALTASAADHGHSCTASGFSEAACTFDCRPGDRLTYTAKLARWGQGLQGEATCGAVVLRCDGKTVCVGVARGIDEATAGTCRAAKSAWLWLPGGVDVTCASAPDEERAAR